MLRVLWWLYNVLKHGNWNSIKISHTETSQQTSNEIFPTHLQRYFGCDKMLRLMSFPIFFVYQIAHIYSI